MSPLPSVMRARCVSPTGSTGATCSICCTTFRGTRRALLPDWSGPPARLAETVIALGALYVALYALGSIGGFHGAPVLIVLVALGVALGYSARWFARPSVANESSAPLPREQWIVFIAAGTTALVAAQW